MSRRLAPVLALALVTLASAARAQSVEEDSQAPASYQSETSARPPARFHPLGTPPPNPAQLQTPDRANQSSVPNAIETPLHDVNLLRQHIPTVLLAAVVDPYAAPDRLSCQRLGELVSELDGALGSDFNMPDTPQHPSLTKGNGNIALTLLSGATRLLIPYDGLVRTVTGAQRHDQMVIEAITAGSVRRGYLKGLGEAYHCPPPALPAHRIDNPSPVAEVRRPAYPIR